MAEDILPKQRTTRANKERIDAIKKMSEKELLQNIAYDMDRVARLIATYFTLFTIIFILWIVFTFVGPFIQEAVGL